MGKLALSYGSEWHLLRYLGRHRAALTKTVLDATGGAKIDWQDFGFTRSLQVSYGDAELKGVDFLDATNPVRAAWETWWPTTGNVPNWDAIGKHTNAEGNTEWLLVEAKAHLDELTSACGAKPASVGGGLDRITDSLNETRLVLGATEPVANWLSPYYQYANRLATLHFLQSRGIPARLVFLYFLGDQTLDKKCPKNSSDWAREIAKTNGHLGLPATGLAQTHVHSVFLPVV